VVWRVCRFLLGHAWGSLNLGSLSRFALQAERLHPPRLLVVLVEDTEQGVTKTVSPWRLSCDDTSLYGVDLVTALDCMLVMINNNVLQPNGRDVLRSLDDCEEAEVWVSMSGAQA
jgi:hypothetical protein